MGPYQMRELGGAFSESRLAELYQKYGLRFARWSVTEKPNPYSLINIDPSLMRKLGSTLLQEIRV